MNTAMRRLTTLVVTYLLLAPLVALASPADLKKAEELLRAGKAAEAYALLEPLEIKYAGDLDYDYLLATASLDSGRPSKATFIYERILAANPDYVGVRADMGRAYYMMGDYAKAKIEFESVLTFSSLPPDLRTTVDQYMSVIEQRSRAEPTVVIGFVEAGIGFDSNTLAATSASTINYANGATANLGPESRKRGNTLRYYLADAEVNHTLEDKEWALYAGGTYRARHHFTLDTSDSYTADVRAGFRHYSGRVNINGGLTYGRYWLDNAATRDSYGANAEWRLTLDELGGTLFVNGAAMRFLYVPEAQRVNDFNQNSATLGWVQVIASGTTGVVSLTAGEEKATGGRLDGDKSYWGLRAQLQHEFNDQLGAFLNANYQPGRYNKTNTDFDISRRDKLSELALGLVWRFPDRWSLRTVVQLSENRSNLPINAYSRTDTGIVLRKDF